MKALSWTLEILPESTSKAAGLRRLLDALGIRPAHVMAVGDGENDLEMMRMVGLPVAMGNAVEALKSPRNVAFVTDSNAEDGVAKVSGFGLGSGLGLGLAIMQPIMRPRHEPIS